MGDDKQEYEQYRLLMYSGGYDPVSYEEWRGIMYSPRPSEVERLRERLAALVSDENAGLVYLKNLVGNWVDECAFCEVQEWREGVFPHTSDCPIVRGRDALAAG